MSDRLSLSIFTIEVDGKPTLAFEAKSCSEAKAICEDEELRPKLSLLKSGDVPICADKALLDVRLARPDEAALYRQAARASQSTDNLMLVYLSRGGWAGGSPPSNSRSRAETALPISERCPASP
jgi:hypothetical protein